MNESNEVPESVRIWGAIELLDKSLKELWIGEEFEKAIELAEEGFGQKKDEASMKGMAYYLHWLGRIAESQNRLEDAEKYFKEGIDLVSKDGFKEGIVE